MANHIIQFKSQKEINRDRQLKLEQSKEDIRRRVEEIKNSQNQKRQKVKA
ncbi:hypothetical protein [Litchfieldia alkalitelluris]|nr:hypothetical protein [Litchfieldia alkalitelluris]